MSREFGEIINESPVIKRYIGELNPISFPQRIESKWRSNNDLFIINTEFGKFVLKKTNQATWESDINYHKTLSQHYGAYVPTIRVEERDTILMEYVDGLV